MTSPALNLSLSLSLSLGLGLGLGLGPGLSVLLGASTFAAPAGPELLAPGPRELDASAARLRRTIVRAEAIGVAVERLQNALGRRFKFAAEDDQAARRQRAKTTVLAPSASIGPGSGPAGAEADDRVRPPPVVSCDDEVFVSLLVRARIFLQSYRDWSQSARAQRDRVARIRDEGAVRPILDERERATIQALFVRVDVESRKYLEAMAWHRRYLGVWSRRCPGDLRVSRGLMRSTLRAPSDPIPLRAVIGRGGGRICPDDLLADGEVVVLKGTSACYSASRAEACDCVPTTVLPGAVLGAATEDGGDEGRVDGR
ncbi:MAG: hypothetical protein IPK13_04250 [Deltaproteobacteria bacterium]|nr:hypothetical protein [Deltaproteobacteria bacterium]